MPELTLVFFNNLIIGKHESFDFHSKGNRKPVKEIRLIYLKIRIWRHNFFEVVRVPTQIDRRKRTGCSKMV